MRRIYLASLIATCGLALLSSCDIQAQAKERSYALADEYRINEDYTLYLEDVPGGETAEGPLLGTLEMLCGIPAQPQFMLLDEWVDEGYDPNHPTFAADDGGSGELDADEMEALQADNERVFRRQLAAIRAGTYGKVTPFRGAPLLQETWDSLLSDWEFFDAEYNAAMVEWEATNEAWEAYQELSDEERAALGDDHVAPEEPDEEPWHEFSDEDGTLTPEEVFQGEAEYELVNWYPSFRDSADLYRLECLHCHGTEGSGDGSTAPFLYPRPRNYQPGIFKWTALKDKAHPRREDLYKVISEGAYTSAMPAFRRFSRAQIHGLVDMVRLLSIRGETEKLLAIEMSDENYLTPALISQTYADVWDKWNSAADSLIIYDGEVPSPTAESIALGYKLFMDANGGNCFSCHGEKGLGDGAAAWKADEDGVMQRIVDEWGEVIIPRNLTTGIFRGGRRPIDIYRRLAGGINGTPMPAVPDTLTEDDRWAIVHYVLSLSEVHDGRGLDSIRMRKGDGDHGDGHGDDDADSHADGHDSDEDH